MGYQNFFATKLTNDIGAADTSIVVDQAPTATSGRLVLEARNPTQREIIKYTGVAGNTLTGVTRGQGGTSAKSHLKSALVEMNATSEDLQDLYDAFNSFAASNSSGWFNQVTQPVSTVYNGHGSYTHTYGASIAALKAPGYRNKYVRTVAANTYMGGLFNGTNHYFTKVTPTGNLSTITNNITVIAEIEPTTYGLGMICGRTDAAPANGWFLRMEADGRIFFAGYNAAGYRSQATYASPPLNKKTQIAVSWASGVIVIYFNGVPQALAAQSTGGAVPTTFGLGGDFSIGRSGSFNSQYYAGGYISNVGVFSAVLTASEVRSYRSQPLLGSETNCIGAWSLNNTAVNQQAPGTNDLTATNGVGYTLRPPMTQNAASLVGVTQGTTSYSITQSVSADGLTEVVQCAEGDTIPTSGGITSMQYSPHKAPYGFPAQVYKWTIEHAEYVQHIKNPASASYTNHDSNYVTFPPGEWLATFSAIIGGDTAGSNDVSIFVSLSTSTTAVSDARFTLNTYFAAAGNGYLGNNQGAHTVPLSLATLTTYYFILKKTPASNNSYYGGNQTPTIVKLVNAYL